MLFKIHGYDVGQFNRFVVIEKEDPPQMIRECNPTKKNDLSYIRGIMEKLALI